MCKGSWSVPSYHEIVIDNLAPPAFHDSSLIFLAGKAIVTSNLSCFGDTLAIIVCSGVFADDSPVPGNFFDANLTEGASLLVWNNVSMIVTCRLTYLGCVRDDETSKHSDPIPLHRYRGNYSFVAPNRCRWSSYIQVRR